MRCLYLGSDGFGTYEIDLNRRSFQRVEGNADTVLVPGFVDTHTHGAFGIDFMSATKADMGQLCRKLREVGYESFLPTTVTASLSDVERAFAALPDDPMVLGVHLEGPFVSLKYPGAQPQAFIVNPPSAPSDWFQVLDDPRLKLITMAPELPGATALISHLTSRGVRVSMGHTNATYEEAESGFRAGADHATHTFNAMRPLHHREAGMVGYALGNDELFAELIYDRLHVKRQSAEVLFRCKPSDRVVAVSDSTMAAGMAPGQSICMWGLTCVVGDKEVRLTDGTLAGSAITLFDAFRNLYEDFGPETAVKACSLNPRLSIGHLAPPSLYVEFDRSLEIVGLHELAA
jgi:N-acetylglucosamine-6-phosphate deacetylase